MKEEREIVSVSLPLFCGALLGTFLTAVPSVRYPAVAASCCATLLGACFLYLLSGRGRRYAAVMVLFGLTGLFCGVNGAFSPAGEDALSGPVSAASEALRRTVREIPFPSEETGALVLALTTGDRSLLGRETVQVFRQSGASHLLALSGLHLGILYLLLSWMTKPLGNSIPAKRCRSVFLVVAAGAYALVTGASPSIVRAFLFILLRETGLLLGRRPSPFRVLCGALTLQVALTPSVVTSVGFQLSYLAVAGIVLLYPRMQAWYPSEGFRRDRWNLPRRLWDMMALTISCQVFTGPLAWLRFGTFPRYFLLTNLLAMPLASALAALSAVCVLLSALGCCPAWTLAADDVLARLLLKALGIIATM